MPSPFVGCENITTLAHRDAVRRGIHSIIDKLAPMGKGRGRLYAPEHNPDEFLNNDLKQAMARPHGSSPWAEGPRTPPDKAALKSGLTSYMRSLQRCPAKVRTFFQAPTVRYAS